MRINWRDWDDQRAIERYTGKWESRRERQWCGNLCTICWRVESEIIGICYDW